MQVIVDIQNIIREARNRAYQSINVTMVTAYWLIGRRIVEEDQQGNTRADYGKALIETLSESLLSEFGKGFSQRNLEQMRTFYLEYPIPQTVSAEFQADNADSIRETPAFRLSWSHYLNLISIKNIEERRFYEIESIENNWSIRELKRQYDSGLYMRLALSTDKVGVKRLSEKGQLMEGPADAIKDPYILEFLHLKEHFSYSESDLENALIDKLEHFLLELGKGFTFVARQKRITFTDRHFYADLVFYNRLLKCFVIIDLKIGEIQHQDIGQMQMYVNYYDRQIKLDDENKTIGIILCQKKSDLLVELTLPENNDQIFASRYETVLPSKEELSNLLNSKS
ncbi:Putative nuclease YhcG [Dyadobacter sp. CECT 9623]|uniref:Nuclease YhcG n=1 Tax=Dyadobacter linearis TaxID=2823330 RepID=A0ABM8UYA9_9BACT|nr:PDDEXK nuclease domain-containing protein [Dyadobacter sp. CECT 9623]CAG5074656.1 Putative nuclease YhcG [Dyadobacter sp. CECT 9623]